jgi:hypothetical protein
MNEFLANTSLIFAAIPAVLFIWNIKLYAKLKRKLANDTSPVSVLIPARNEEKFIRVAVESVLANTSPEFEIIVLDDHSTDGTAEILRNIAARDKRVRYENAPALPGAWCGKQHACSVLARMARYDTLCFMDADVRLAPDALVRMTTFMHENRASLISGIPHQRTESICETLLIPLIHFMLLGFLPIAGMRSNRHPAFGAACGQLLMMNRRAYEQSGGHASIRTSLHDGLTLPKSFRRAGFHTDLFDATDVASCRMYTSAGETWRGLAKNATEGIASPGRILPFTIILFSGQVLPFVMMATGHTGAIGAVLFALIPRLIAALRFDQSLFGALLHPIGVTVLLAIQWYALIRSMLGWPTGWKGRTYMRAKA